MGLFSEVMRLKCISDHFPTFWKNEPGATPISFSFAKDNAKGNAKCDAKGNAKGNAKAC